MIMAIEASGFAGRIKRSGTFGDNDKVIRKKSCRKNVRIRLKRPVFAVSWTLQKLFQSCQRVFKAHGSVPSPADVQKLCHILGARTGYPYVDTDRILDITIEDGLKPEDVGLHRDLHFFKPKNEVEGAPRVTSATIYKCENFEMCIFFLPAKAVIPLHNHPEMTVFSKLLLGTVHIISYDWVVHPLKSDYSVSTSKRRLAKLKSDKISTTPCDTSVLYPTSGGNIHEFRAITSCVMLDVLGPPYSKNEDRDCSYYRETIRDCPSDAKEFASEMNEDVGCFRFLERIEIPEESEMDGIDYMGPQIIDSAS